MFERIKKDCELEAIERLSEIDQLQILIGVGWRKKEKTIRKIVLNYIKKAYQIRARYVKK